MINNDTEGRHLVLATDGACLGNPGPGGWAVIIQECESDAVIGRSAIAGHAHGDTTNNQMELQAAIEALRHAKHCSLPALIITDSQYVQRGVTEWVPIWKANGWRTSQRKAVKNRVLWETLDKLAVGLSVTWQWVRGHSGHPMNEEADMLAQDAAWNLVNTPDKLKYFHPGLFSEVS